MTETLPTNETLTLFSRMIPEGSQEIISTNSALSLASYVSECSGNISCTLSDAKEPFHAKIVIAIGGANVDVTCTLPSPNTGFNLSANSRCELVWDSRDSNKYWIIISSKGISLLS